MGSPLDDLFRHFYLLRNPYATRPLRLTTEEPPRSFTAERADALLAGAQATEPVCLVWESGGSASDFVWTGYLSIIVVSGRVVETLRETRATGWTTYPIVARDRSGASLQGYFGFAVTGRAGPVDRKRSEVFQKPAPTPTGTVYSMLRGLYFDENTWDGNDIFLVADTLFVVVSERVKRALGRARIGNVRFTRLTDVELHPE